MFYLQIRVAGRGLTRETLISLATTVESREKIQRKHCGNTSIEHPRASTTDDVECF